VVAENAVTGEKIHQTVEMVVLATGMQPTAANAKLPADLKLYRRRLHHQRFRKGRHVRAGCANKPADVVSSNQNATGMALKAIQTLVKEVGGIHGQKIWCVYLQGCGIGEALDVEASSDVADEEGFPTKTHPILCGKAGVDFLKKDIEGGVNTLVIAPVRAASISTFSASTAVSSIASTCAKAWSGPIPGPSSRL
jgi:heterodisulfide reductase subunit A-like polyferredoxin